MWSRAACVRVLENEYHDINPRQRREILFMSCGARTLTCFVVAMLLGLLGLLLDAHQFFMLRFRCLGLARFFLGRASEGAVRRRRPSRWRESHHRAKGGLEEKRDLCL